MKKLLLILPLLVAILCTLSASSASAQFGGYGYGLGAFNGPFGYSGNWQSSYSGRTPPYFALHPPVYYSGQINRIPYGSSPYAALPNNNCNAQRGYAPAAPMYSNPGPTSESVGQMIINPHYKPTPGKTTSQPVQATPISEPLGMLIMNPHYRAPEHIAQR